MPTTKRLLGIEGAGRASGHTIVIDTFRAFTTAAVLLDRKVGGIILCADLDEARSIAKANGALLCGEEGGVRPPDFHLGNSPAEATTADGIEGQTVVMRTSAGTRSVLAALGNGATPVYAASLVVAGATARLVNPGSGVSIVAAGLGGAKPAEEDELTADYIEDLLAGRGDPEVTSVLVATCERAGTLASAPWAHAGDVAIATDVDRYGFAMEAVRRGDLVHLEVRR